MVTRIPAHIALDDRSQVCLTLLSVEDKHMPTNVIEFLISHSNVEKYLDIPAILNGFSTLRLCLNPYPHQQE
ncbi:MAG: hypothetical protein JSV76_04650 [Candidatus Bathyarchaeota archaeon]|nr:MAG: hypothetical protein JSV76_04650 [Candidatus Bathyarchaeota archaeon]